MRPLRPLLLALATFTFCHPVLLTRAQDPPAAAAAAVPRLRALDFSLFTAALANFTPDRAAQLHTAVKTATLTEVQAALTTGIYTAEELTLYFLQRIQRYDETLRSYMELNPACLDEARASDRRRASGKLLGPLDGIPINLKDNIGTAAPLHTTAGAEILLNDSPDKNAAVTRRLRAAGTVLLGKASLSELAGTLTTQPPGYNAISGIGVNAYRRGLPVSGSSSGSAISTSAGLTLLSVGSETSGSLIAPGSSNGVVAMKPGLGVVSGEGIIPLIRFQDSAGPMARHVADAAAMLSVMDEKDTDYLIGLQPDALAGVPVGVLRASLSDKSSGGNNTEWLRRIDEGLTKAKSRRPRYP